VAKFKRKADTEFDVDRPVVVCAKGPTFDVFPQFNFENYYTASLTTTANLIKTPIDFLFFNDIEAFKQIKDKVFDNVANVVCPLVLHENEKPSKEYTSGYIKVALENKNLNIFTYRLKTQESIFAIDHKEQDATLLNDGNNHSVLDTAIAWFISLGFYKFILVGVSDESEYAENFGKEKEEVFSEREPEWYQVNFMMTTSLLKKNSCKAVLVKDDKGGLLEMNCKANLKPTIEIV